MSSADSKAARFKEAADHDARVEAWRFRFESAVAMRGAKRDPVNHYVSDQDWRDLEASAMDLMRSRPATAEGDLVARVEAVLDEINEWGHMPPGEDAKDRYTKIEEELRALMQSRPATAEGDLVARIRKLPTYDGKGVRNVLKCDSGARFVVSEVLNTTIALAKCEPRPAAVQVPEKLVAWAKTQLEDGPELGFNKSDIDAARFILRIHDGASEPAEPSEALCAVEECGEPAGTRCAKHERILGAIQSGDRDAVRDACRAEPSEDLRAELELRNRQNDERTDKGLAFMREFGAEHDEGALDCARRVIAELREAKPAASSRLVEVAEAVVEEATQVIKQPIGAARRSATKRCEVFLTQLRQAIAAEKERGPEPTDLVAKLTRRVTSLEAKLGEEKREHRASVEHWRGVAEKAEASKLFERIASLECKLQEALEKVAETEVSLDVATRRADEAVARAEKQVKDSGDVALIERARKVWREYRELKHKTEASGDDKMREFADWVRKTGDVTEEQALGEIDRILSGPTVAPENPDNPRIETTTFPAGKPADTERGEDGPLRAFVEMMEHVECPLVKTDAAILELCRSELERRGGKQ